MIRGEGNLGLTGFPVYGLVGCRPGSGSRKLIERVPRGNLSGGGPDGGDGLQKAIAAEEQGRRWLNRLNRGRHGQPNNTALKVAPMANQERQGSIIVMLSKAVAEIAYRITAITKVFAHYAIIIIRPIVKTKITGLLF